MLIGGSDTSNTDSENGPDSDHSGTDTETDACESKEVGKEREERNVQNIVEEFHREINRFRFGCEPT